MPSLLCPRCGSMMRLERIIHAGDACLSGICMACGETIDPVILANRAEMKGERAKADQASVR